MSYLTVSYFYWHLLGNKDICAQFLKDRELRINKITGNRTETQPIKLLWKRVKNKYSIKSCRCTELFEYKNQEDNRFLIL